MKIVIVGSGFLGVALAYALAEAHADVTVVDGGLESASSATLAWIGASHPGLRSYWDLNALGVSCWRHLPRTVSRDIRFGGSLFWSSTRPDLLGERVEDLDHLGYPALSLSQHQVQTLEPDVRIQPRSAAFFPGEAWLEAPERTLAAARSAAESLGAKFAPSTLVSSLERDRTGRVTLNPAGALGLTADIVVLCAGAGTDVLARAAGYGGPPLLRTDGAGVVGALATLACRSVGIERLIYADGVMLRPSGNGSYVARSDSVDERLTDGLPLGERERRELGSLIREEATRLVPALQAARVVTVRIGRRVLPADGRPVIGWLPGSSAVYVIATHSGVTLAPALGALVSAELLTGEECPALKTYRPSRLGRAS